MKDWFDEWLNSPGPPEDNDNDLYYQDGHPNHTPQNQTNHEIAYLALVAIILAIAGTFIILTATLITLAIISLIVHNQILQWATLIATITLALRWANNKTHK